MGGSDRVETAALVISLVALIGTFLQVAQQYFASATGYANCKKSLSGGWLAKVHRRFRLLELRFEVEFETPVIFVCKPDNKRGPVQGADILFLTHKEKSKIEAGIWTSKDQKQERQRQIQHNRVHTADNEEATWLKLLRTIHDMEKTSAAWVQDHHEKSRENQLGPIKTSNKIFPRPKHSLVVALQAKPQSWDNMPTSVKKPFATTTMCHIVEIAAMMGIYWKEFDRSRDKYRAEGNGFMLTGSTVADLGLCFTFQICGKARFRENRIIPVDGVKSLCFGYVPTLFQEEEDIRRIDAKDPDELQFGSMLEIAETMVALKCNTNTANYFKTLFQGAKHQHLFAVPFEIIGMLGKSLYKENSYYRMLPNPTPYTWDENFFNLSQLIQEYEKRIKEREQTPQIKVITDLAGKVLKQLDGDRLDVKHREEERNRLIEQDKLEMEDRKAEWLKKREKRKEIVTVKAELTGAHEPKRKPTGWFPWQSPKKRARTTLELAQWRAANPDEQEEEDDEDEEFQGDKKDRPPVVPGYYLPLLNTLHQAIETCDVYLKKCVPRDLLDLVVREHIQEVLRIINVPETESQKDDSAQPPEARDETPKDGKKPTPQTFFEQLSAANPEDRQGKFMDRYFDQVLPWATGRAVESFNKLKPSNEAGATIADTKEAQETWCTLVFRMLCWLQLHDFDNKDKQVEFPKSGLRGNRLPVFIS
ncbi:hypothetical protein B0H65DRAFT_428499 [Neurospora tetraspora]|uniref:Modin n=1 Tax=Neurospora tetraspora TaxID=94610 RepID=A0AAE0JD11_9PEZI|nr:hypothetical protein B0H65DRAFT_428499 [Neurospora tetraspora]